MAEVTDGIDALVRRLGAVVTQPQPDQAVDFELPTGLAGFASPADTPGDVRVSFVIALDAPRTSVETWLSTASTEIADATLEVLPSASTASIRLLVRLPREGSEDRCCGVAREAVRLHADWREYQTSDNPPDVDALRDALVRLVYPLGALRRDLEGDLLLDDAIAQLHIYSSQCEAVRDDTVGAATGSDARCCTEVLHLMSLFLHGVRHGGF